MLGATTRGETAPIRITSNISPSPNASGTTGNTSRSLIHNTCGTDIPPLGCLVDSRHPLLRNFDPRAEALLLNVQNPSALLSNSGQEDKSSMVGTLRAMCSKEEMMEKQATSTASDLERLAVTADLEGRYVNKHLAVKSFQRSDASKVFLPIDTRPILWCRRTVHNLLVLQLDADKKECPWLFKRESDAGYRFIDVYNFIRDRLRGVWQDLTIQHCPTHRGSIESLEISCRFLLFSDELLCEEPEFDAVQNGALISTCLEKLMLSYHAIREFRQSSEWQHLQNRTRLSPIGAKLTDSELTGLLDILVYESPFEAEFWSYRILLCLSSGSQAASLCMGVQSRMPRAFSERLEVKIALEAVASFRDGNAVRFFKLQSRAPFLLAVVMSKFRNLVRMTLLHTLSCDSVKKQGMGSRIPFKVFQSLFNFEKEKMTSVDDFCRLCHIQSIFETNSPAGEPSFIDLVPNRKRYEDIINEGLRAKRIRNERLKFEEGKLGKTRAQIIDPRPFEDGQESDNLQPKQESRLKSKLARLKNSMDVIRNHQGESPVNSESYVSSPRRRPTLDSSSAQEPPVSLFQTAIAGANEDKSAVSRPMGKIQRSRVFTMAKLASQSVELGVKVSPSTQPSKVKMGRLEVIVDSPGFPISAEKRLSTPFGVLPSSPSLAASGEQSGDVATPESITLPHFGSGSETSDVERKQPSVNGEVIGRRNKRRIGTATGSSPSLREVSLTQKKKSRLASEEPGEPLDFTEDGRQIELETQQENVEPIPSSAASGDSIGVQEENPLKNGLSNRSETGLEEYRLKLGLSLEIAGASIPSVCCEGIYAEICKGTESCRWALELFDDVSITEAMGKISSYSGVAENSLLKPKFVNWSIAFHFSDSLSSLMMDSILHGIIWKDSSKWTADGPPFLSGALSGWSSRKLVKVESICGRHVSRWLRESRCSAAICLSCQSQYHSQWPLANTPLSSGKNPSKSTSPLIIWVFRKSIPARHSMFSGERTFNLEKGASRVLGAELDFFHEFVTKASRHDVSMTSIVFLCDVTIRSGSCVTDLSSLASESTSEIVSILSKVLSVKIIRLIERRSKDAPGKWTFISQLLNQHQTARRPFSFPIQLTVVAEADPCLSPFRLSQTDMTRSGASTARVTVRKKSLSGSEDRGRFSHQAQGSGVRCSSWSVACNSPSKLPVIQERRFLVKGLVQALETSAKSIHTFVASLLELPLESKRKRLKLVPADVAWCMKVTERAPFVLLNLWKRQIVALESLTMESLLSALPQGIEAFSKSLLWDIPCVSMPDEIQASLSSSFDMVSEDEETPYEDDGVADQDTCEMGSDASSSPIVNDARSLIIQDREVIRQYLMRLSRAFTRVLNTLEVMSQIRDSASETAERHWEDEDEKDEQLKSPGRKSLKRTGVTNSIKTFYASRRIVRLLIRYVLDSIDWYKKRRGFLLEASFRLPLPLFLYASATEKLIWGGRSLPPQFYRDEFIGDKPN